MLSRLWYLVLASIAAIGIAAGFLAQATFDSRTIAHVDDQLLRDRTEVELWLRYEARLRIDSIQPLTVRAEVRNALRQASGRRDRRTLDESLRTSLTGTLNTLNRQLREGAAQLLFAVDADGEIVAQLGGTRPPAGAGLARFPLVADALRGYVGDDLWLCDGSVYRMAARPVIDGGQYVGAIVHGSVVDAAFASRIAERIPGATLAFHFDGAELGSSRPSVAGAPAGTEVLAAWGEAAANEEYLERGRSLPLELGETDVRAVFSRMVGSAGAAGVGYAVARPAQRLGSPVALFDSVPEEAVGELPWALVVGIPLLLALLGIGFLFFEQSRPQKVFAQVIAELGDGKATRIEEKRLIGAKFRRLGAAINDALDKAAARGGGGRKKQDLDAILGEDDGAESPGFFGMAAPEQSSGDLFGGALAPAEAADPFAAAPMSASADAPAQPKAAPPKPPAPQAPNPKPPAPKAAPPAPPKAPAAPPKPPGPPAAPPSPPDDLAPPIDAHDRQTSPPPPAEPPPAQPMFDDEDEDNRTVVTRVPDSLLEQSGGAPETSEGEMDLHFREVFHDFVALKRECGESTTGLTFEKFKATLMKNRQAIVAKHGAVGVRFSVYRKNGRAALKATPLKD